MRFLIALFIVAASASLAGQEPSWPQFRANPQLTGVTSATLPESLKVMWTFDAGSGVESSAAISDGTVYVGSTAGELIALDLQTGAVRWRYKTGEIGESSPAAANGVVYIGDLTGVFHAVDAKTGKAVWRATIDDTKAGFYSTGVPLVADGKLIVGNSGGDGPTRGFVAAYDIETGKQVWKTYTIPGPGEPGNET